MDRPKQVSWRDLTTYLGSNAKVLETQFYYGVFTCINVELLSMQDCWYKLRSKVVGGVVCVGT